MASTRINLTKAVIDALPAAAAGKRTYLYDTHQKAKGLVVAVTDRGKKSFLVYRWVNGRPERITLGRYPQLTVENARTLANQTNIAIAGGQNPAEKKRAGRGEITLSGLFDDYMTRHAEVHNRRPDKARGNYRRYLSHWANRKLSHIRKADILALHAKVGREHGKVTANIAVKLLRSLFNRAIEWEFWNKPNPAKGLRFYPEESRERFLQPDELPRFFKALADEENETIRDYLIMSLLTGARQSNVLTMRWQDVNLERAEWRMPNTTTKSGKAHTVPLLAEAVDLLKRRQPPAEEGKDPKPYVFPGAGKAGHLIEPKKGWRRVLDRAELYQLVEWLTDARGWNKKQIEEAMSRPDHRKALKELRAAVKALGKDPGLARFPDIRIHDLRRTLGSWQAATGASLPMIGRTLAHKNVSTTAIYARLNLDPVRASMQKAATAMMAAGGLLPQADVVPIKGKQGRKKA